MKLFKKSMCQFIESIKIKNGQVYNLSAHNQRLNQTRRKQFGLQKPLNLKKHIRPPEVTGFYKCRIVYGREIHKIEYLPYALPTVRSLKIVWDNYLDYSLKSKDRSALQALYEQRGTADDILIVKNGFITDTYFCNVVFEKEGKRFTPITYLLNGTKRQTLLKNRQIEEKAIPASEIKQFERVYLINALIDLEDAVTVEINNIIGVESLNSSEDYS